MNNSLKKEVGALVGVISATMLLTACDGDQITQVTKTGIESVAAYEDLSECSDKNDGEMVFVKDSGAVYLCSDKNWNAMNGGNGKNGANGSDGKNGTNGSDGKNGTSCTVKALDDGSGYDVLCGDKVVGHLLNGEKGENGKNGDDGKSCTVKENKDKNGYDLDCGGEVVTITNGADGKSAYDIAKENGFEGTKDEWLESLKGKSQKGEPGEGCTAKSVEDGVEITCGNSDPVVVHNGTNGTSASDDDCEIIGDKGSVVTFKCSVGEYFLIKQLYKAVCVGTPYDPETSFCHDNSQVFPLCNGQEYDFKKEFCAQRGNAVEGVYGKVKIGQQTWMAENLNYETENSKCGGGEGTEEGDCSTYGRLYTWTDAVGKTVQGICPDGWHLPSKADWEFLIATVNTSTDKDKNNAALHLKANSALWNDYTDPKDSNLVHSGAGDNTSGFTALPSGRYSDGEFRYSDEAAYFWSATEDSYSGAYYMILMDENDEAAFGGIGKDYMYSSVRCIQD